MGKRDRIKRVFKSLRPPSQASAPPQVSAPPSQASASEPASYTANTVLEVGPHLNEPTDRPNGSASNTEGSALESQLNQPTDRTQEASLIDSQSQDAPVKDLWSLALEKLSSEDKETMLCIGLNSKLDILQHLKTTARKKQIECEDQRWKFELNGRSIIIRDVLEKIIVWIDKFKQIGDIAVNFDPVHASLPWAGVRFLLEVGSITTLNEHESRLIVKQIAVAETQQMGALLIGVEKISLLICRCRIYESLYLKTEESDQEDWKSAVTSLTSALMTLYAAMLSFLANAIRAYNQSTLGRTLSAILSPDGFLDKCQTLENTLVTEVGNCEHIHTRKIQASSEKQIQKLKTLLEDSHTPILRIDSRVAGLCEELDSSEREKILTWISGIPYEGHHIFVREEWTSGTGKWLLQHGKYHEWRASSASMILWLHGDRECRCNLVLAKFF